MSASPPEETPAPHDLDLVVEFVNTLDPDDGSDELADVAGVKRWLTRHKLMPRNARAVRERERREAIDLREALRAAMLEHNGVGSGGASPPILERVARRGKLAVHFRASGEAVLAADAPGFAGALARLLIPVYEADRDGSWARAKACRAGDCQWAFYDRSRNRSGTWCDMAVCGNRSKVRRYRSRTVAAR